MAISEDEVKKVARLARLAVPEERLAAYTQSLSNILNLVDQLSAVDTTGVEPMAHPLDMVQRLREDVVTETDHRAQYQAIAPEVEKGLYLVPKVIE
ncbi:Asp-tRNA(Asn)/Glu-tRNA(Gln) amidotransferase subunit GatC [Thiothrix litoralis]|jgi:aspartyl-tRNA(Asn)/glutamyl-tRNA(Gln) amidotransferase subunit C|uniref:Aspartyl/glutamyl-tRNA(Asn/Gln) amidotransferase subunit C n=1 Tax=Thiothrix litoralis TaxID=2891210 RepID=A0ABX7WN74_9GAMM|nr:MULTISPECIES: Asp-tRNA(Asn)/Glu-tRNA(Gln) amidotransferase subunit GatC [Thiothrix]QTR45019.1 Asp-tRNA(Asn)/Glu-tRNA(Gln) amidotransferase subunit GatC [Thiothrix litoralis]WMP16207.1 Asp-tRNA(Asn)/Glu-tRNA(Gln) amidotransferase subunit GatC [Thiothrix lacustris]